MTVRIFYGVVDEMAAAPPPSHPLSSPMVGGHSDRREESHHWITHHSGLKKGFLL